MTEPTRPVLRYHGGKWKLAPWIVQHFPSHRVYTEAFGGAGSVLMRKERARMVEVYNDLDEEVVNVFRMLRSPTLSLQLTEALTLTPYCRAEFELSYEPADDPLEQARRTIVRAFQGFGTNGVHGTKTGFRANGNRQSAHPANDWKNYPPAVATFCARLAGVVIENRPAIELLLQQDGPQALHYVDPPYVHETRSEHIVKPGKGYRHELTADDHRHLAEVLCGLQGMVVVSGYHSPLYDELYEGWTVTQRDTHADGGLERTEVLWLNPACTAALEHGRGLFAEAFDEQP